MSRPTFEAAKAQYVHRFTMEHVPQWANRPRYNGTYYGPAYRSDQEWYDNTKFPGEPGHTGWRYCYSTSQTFPLGPWLLRPYQRGAA